ncbi:MAG: protein kinase [Planctomycetaceae bacterium]|nr:protein kinase [Planctomycetaceae bacterium]
MSACPSIDELRRFLDGVDVADASTATAKHIDSCPECQQRLDQLTEPSFLDDSVDESIGGESSSGLDLSRMLDRIQRERSDEEPRLQMAHHRLPTSELPGYTILKHLGSGAGGDVYQARDEKLGRQVAIKVLKSELAAQKESLARFEREARAAAALENEHIVRLHALLQLDGMQPCLVFEHIEGESLKQRLAEEEVISPREAAAIVIAVASGLSAAHHGGVIHRDIKPSNVLIERRTGRVKIADFGLARFAEVEAELTHEGMLAGTPNYMSPEQVQNPQCADARSDIYSVGVLLYEMLTGVVPYRGTVRMVLQRRIHEDPLSLRRLNDAVPRDLETICLKAMSRDPARRYQSGEELIDDLTRWLEGRPIHARPVGAAERVWRWSRRNPTIARLSALVIVMVCAGLVAMAWFTLWLAESKRNAERLTQQSNEHARLYQLQRDLAVRHLDQMVHEVQNELGERPETRQLRNRLFDIAMKGLADVQETGDFSLTGAVSSADALNRLGDLARELGDHQKARHHYQQAYDVLKELPDSPLHQFDIQRSKAMTLCNIGDVVALTGDDRSAMTQYREAISLLNDVMGSDEGNRPLTCRSLAIVTERLGDLFRRQSNWDEAARSYQQAVSLITEQPGAVESETEQLRGIAVLVQKQADIAVQQMNLSEAAAYLSDGHQRFSELSEQNPKNIKLQRDLAVSYARQAELKVLTEDLAGANQAFAEASHLFDQLRHDDPESLVLMRDLAAIRSRQGELAFELGRWSEAEDHLKSAVEIFERLNSSDQMLPDDAINLQRCRKNLRLVKNRSANLRFLKSSPISLEEPKPIGVFSVEDIVRSG